TLVRMSPYGLWKDTWPAYNSSKEGTILLTGGLPGMRSRLLFTMQGHNCCSHLQDTGG
ncbi:hypothetical protein PSTG_20059, partial [Puccinia striiformis f. sp. tritici PST-78]